MYICIYTYICMCVCIYIYILYTLYKICKYISGWACTVGRCKGLGLRVLSRMPRNTEGAPHAHVHTHTSIHLDISYIDSLSRTHMYTHTYMHANTRIHTYINTYTQTHVYIHTRSSARIAGVAAVYACMCEGMQNHTNTCVYTFMCIRPAAFVASATVESSVVRM